MNVTFHCCPRVPQVRPVVQAAHGGPLFCASEKHTFRHKDSDAVNSANTKSSIFKGRVQESHTDSMRMLSVLPRLPRRLNETFIETNMRSQAPPFLGKGQKNWKGKLQNNSIISALIEEDGHEEISIGGKKQLSILVFFFALFLIFDFYRRLKTPFFPARMLWYTSLNHS